MKSETGKDGSLRRGSDDDIVGDRRSLVFIGMAAVWLACLVFAVMRLGVTLQTGKLTPWWANAIGVAAITALYFWYRAEPEARSPAAAHGTALVASLALLVPVAYGMSSTIWWLALVGFAMVLLGRRNEARTWGVAIPLLVAATVVAEPYVQVQGAAGERMMETELAKVGFVLLVVGMAAAFRRVAERRAVALHESEERYRMLFQRVPVGVFHYDQNLRITECNQHVASILGSDSESLIGLDLGSLRDSRPLPAIRAALAGESSAYDGPFHEAEGRPEVSVSIRTVPLHAADASIMGAICLVEDVTLRRRMEAELRRAHDELEERVRDRTEELRRRSRALQAMTECNQALARASSESALLDEVCRIIGETSADRFVWAEVPSSPELIAVQPSSRFGTDKGLLDGLLARGSGMVTPFALALRTGELQVTKKPDNDPGLAPFRQEMQDHGFASAIALPLRADGAMLGMLGVLDTAPGAFDAAETALLQELADDVAFGIVALRARAARELAERALGESEERYRLLFERNLAGVFRWNVDGRVMDCNESCARIFGYASREEMLSIPVSQLFETPREGAQALEGLRAGGQLLNHERRYRRKDGRLIWVIENMTLTGDVVEGTLVDVTERRSLEEQFRQSQRMDAVGRLAGGVAHDFNNLLSVMLSYTDFALEALSETDPTRGDLLEVSNAGKRAAALTRQLLAFGRKQIFEPGPLNLNQTATECEKMLRRILGEDIDFVQKLAPDLGVALADAGQIEQVLMNLVVNARDSMPTGGKLTIETRNVELDDAYAALHVDVKPGPYILLAVTDTGCGMNEETQARIFEPFFTTKEKGKGTGLGLSTVYGIVKQSNGHITVYSEPGHGSTFKVYLPREHGQTQTSFRCPPSSMRTVGTETILIVEDEEAVRNLAGRILALAGYTVLMAASGPEALKICDEYAGEIHLVLSDVVMPQMSGKALAERLAQAHPGLKILFMSGYTDDAIHHHGVLDPGTQFIGKPFNSAELKRKVREVIDGG